MQIINTSTHPITAVISRQFTQGPLSDSTITPGPLTIGQGLVLFHKKPSIEIDLTNLSGISYHDHYIIPLGVGTPLGYKTIRNHSSTKITFLLNTADEIPPLTKSQYPGDVNDMYVRILNDPTGEKLFLLPPSQGIVYTDREGARKMLVRDLIPFKNWKTITVPSYRMQKTIQ